MVSVRLVILDHVCGSTTTHSSQVQLIFLKNMYHQQFCPGEPTLPDYMRTFNDIEYGGRKYDFTKVYNVIEIFPTHDLARLTPGDILALLQCSVHVV